MEVDTNAIDVTDYDYGKGKLEESEMNLFVVSYEQSSKTTEMSLSLYDKVETSRNETAKAKNKLLKMFDFLEKQKSITGENKEKIKRQKVRFSAMIENWMSICNDISSEWADYKNCNFLTNTLDSLSKDTKDSYLEQISEDRFNYRAESAKWYHKYCLAMSEVRRLQTEVIDITRNRSTVKLNGFHKRTLRPTNAIQPRPASADVISVSNYENMTSNFKLLKIRGQYEAQIIAAEKVHKLLEEQNQLLCAEMTMLQAHNKMLMNRCNLLERNGPQFEKADSSGKEERDVDSKYELMLMKENHLECKNPIVANAEMQDGSKITEYQYNMTLLQKESEISHFKAEREKLRAREKEIADLKCELEKSKEMTELYRSKSEDANSVIADLSANKKTIEKELQEANNTMEDLRSKVKHLTGVNMKLDDYKKSSVEILTSVRKLETNLHLQKVETDRLLLQAQERKDKNKKYNYAK